MVARLPEALLVEPLVEDNESGESTVTAGVLRKQESGRGEFVTVFLELRDARLACFETEDAARVDNARPTTSLDLKTVTSLRPDPDTDFGMTIVAPARSWVLVPDSEDDCIRWLHALTAQVPFAAVHVIFTRAVFLQEVQCERPTDVRLVAMPSDTVGELIEHIFNCYMAATYTLPLRAFEPDTFVLCIEDADRTWSELLSDRSRAFNASARVRDAVAAHRTLRAYVLDADVVAHNVMPCKTSGWRRSLCMMS